MMRPGDLTEEQMFQADQQLVEQVVEQNKQYRERFFAEVDKRAAEKKVRLATTKTKRLTICNRPDHAAFDALLEAAALTILHFQRRQASGNFQGDDEHEAWTSLTKAISLYHVSKQRHDDRNTTTGNTIKPVHPERSPQLIGEAWQGETGAPYTQRWI